MRRNIVDHDNAIDRGEKMSEVPKKWLRACDVYGVEILVKLLNLNDVALVLAVTVAADTLAQD